VSGICLYHHHEPSAAASRHPPSGRHHPAHQKQKPGRLLVGRRPPRLADGCSDARPAAEADALGLLGGAAAGAGGAGLLYSVVDVWWGVGWMGGWGVGCRGFVNVCKLSVLLPKGVTGEILTTSSS